MVVNLKIQDNGKKVRRRVKIDFAVFAVICMAVGFVFLGKNTGNIKQSLFEALISWQMLLVVIGLYSISYKKFLWGTFVAGVGVFFLIPYITGEGKEWISIYWPLVFVFVGLLLLIKLLIPKQKKSNVKFYETATERRTENGFVFSENSFSAAKHVVMDEVFKGARITCSFGGSELDLRRTSLQEGDTFIDVDSQFGGVEIYLPNKWLKSACPCRRAKRFLRWRTRLKSQRKSDTR